MSFNVTHTLKFDDIKVEVADEGIIINDSAYVGWEEYDEMLAFVEWASNFKKRSNGLIAKQTTVEESE